MESFQMKHKFNSIICMKPTITIKRAYDKPSKTDGRRILADRLWPRGLTKDKAAIDEWAKELAPTSELRKWFGHKPELWREWGHNGAFTGHGSRVIPGNCALQRERDALHGLARKLQRPDVACQSS